MPLSDAMKAEGWIEHDGGPCPVPLDSRPAIMRENGEVIPEGVISARLWTMGYDNWKQQRFENNRIIAFKPEPSHD